MIMMSDLKNIFAAAAVLAALTVSAKDLKTEITVDRTVVPVERQATRLGAVNPRLIPTVTPASRLTIADYTTPAELTRSIHQLQPAAYADTFAISPYRGYASLGYFPAFNLGASAGYRFINTSRTRLGAWMQYDGNSYSGFNDNDLGLDYQPSDKGKYKNNTVTVAASFDQRVGKSSALDADISYTFSSLGLPDKFDYNKQSVNIFDFSLGWWSRASEAVGYHISGSFSHFGYGKELGLAVPAGDQVVDGVKSTGENLIGFKAGVTYFGASKAPRAGIELSGDFLSRSTSYNPGIIGGDVPGLPLSDKTIGIVSVNPYYMFGSAPLSARIGARIDISTGGNGKKFHVAPAVMIDWNPDPRLAFYARVEGGERLNSLRSIYNYCPYINFFGDYQRSNIPVDLRLGVNIGPFEGFSAGIFGNYAVAKDWLMPAMKHTIYLLDGPVSDPHMYENVKSFFMQRELKGWVFGASMAYQWRSIARAEVSAEIAEKSYYLWRDRAKYVLGASIEVSPISRLKIDVGYKLRARRRCDLRTSAIGNDYTPLNLRNISDLSVGASFALTDALSVFARGENILNRHYYMAFDLEAQGVKGLVGASYKF